MVPRFWLAAPAFLVACAPAQVRKMSFADAFPAAPPAPARPRVVRQKPATPPEATPSTELQGALAGFAARARAHRGGRGAISDDQLANWRNVLAEVDQFLDARAATATSSFDVIRARVTLEAELELDALAYRDLPADLAEDILQRVTRLGVRMAEVRRLGVRSKTAKIDFAWPVRPVAVTSLFGRRLHPIAREYRQHLGVDLAAADGQVVFASAVGTVVQAAWNGAHGRMVELQHANGITTRYSHLSELLVDVGTVLKQGEPLGMAGATGGATGPHLHFELWRFGVPVDPLEALGDPSLGATLLSALP